MSKRMKQRGAASVLIVFIIMVVVGGMLAATVLMSSSSITDTSQQSDQVEAVYMAESALDRAVFLLNKAPLSCATLPDGIHSFSASSSFEIVSGTGDAVNCTVKVRGIKNEVVFLVSAIIHNNGGTGTGTPAAFSEHFPNLAGWSWNPISTQGTVGLDTGNNCGVCPGSSDFSVTATIDGGGGNRTLDGYGEKILPATIDTTGGGITVDWSIGFQKDIIGLGVGVQQRLNLELFATGTGNTIELWRDWATIQGGAWTVASGTGFALPTGHVYDRVRVGIHVRGRPGRVPFIWLDEVQFSSGGIGSAANWSIATWQELSI